MRLADRLAGRPSFERLWMTWYIDLKMVVDASATRRLLAWTTKPRFHIMRRLLFLVENMKRDPAMWERKNLTMTKSTAVERPDIKIYNAMMDLKDRLVVEHVAYLMDDENRDLFPSYQRLDPQELRLRTELMYQMMESSVRLGDHLSIASYANYLARRRHLEGIRLEELAASLERLALRLESVLITYPGLEEMRESVHHEIATYIALFVDEVEDVYDRMTAGGEEGLP
jgi:hypothetical protein